MMDARFGFEKFTEGPERHGWCINMQPVGLMWMRRSPSFYLGSCITLGAACYWAGIYLLDFFLIRTATHQPSYHHHQPPPPQTVFKDAERSIVRSGVDFYFLQEDGGR